MNLVQAEERLVKREAVLNKTWRGLCQKASTASRKLIKVKDELEDIRYVRRALATSEKFAQRVAKTKSALLDARDFPLTRLVLRNLSPASKRLLKRMGSKGEFKRENKTYWRSFSTGSGTLWRSRHNDKEVGFTTPEEARYYAKTGKIRPKKTTRELQRDQAVRVARHNLKALGYTLTLTPTATNKPKRSKKPRKASKSS